MYLIDLYGKNDWTLIAINLQNYLKIKTKRTGKQCRERFYNHLQSNKKEDWTLEEERILFSKNMVLGNKWTDIAKFLPGR